MNGEFCVCSELAGSSLKASHWTSNAKACLIAWNINEFSFSGLKKSNINQITIDALERAKMATNTLPLRFFNNSFQRGRPRDRNDSGTIQVPPFYLSILALPGSDVLESISHSARSGSCTKRRIEKLQQSCLRIASRPISRKLSTMIYHLIHNVSFVF